MSVLYPRKALNCLCLLVCIYFISLSAVAEQVWAGSEVTAKLSVSDEMTADSTDLLGDAVDLYTGSLSFYHTDISIPGNFDIPVSFGRRFHGADYYQRAGVEFGDWGLNIPSISYIVAEDRKWPNDRCTNPSSPGPVRSDFGSIFETHEYWNGINLNLENGQSKKLLINQASGYPVISGANLFTKDNWAVTCISSIGTGLGEGFVARSPNGIKYTFSKLTYETATPLMKEFKPLERKVARMLVTKISDQWGNYVNYNYSGNGLTSISSSDGRTISITYNSDGKIKNATANGKTWSYTYKNDSYGRPYLTKVTLPDGRYWSLSLYDLGTTQVMSNFRSPTGEPPYQISAVESGERSSATGSITHPNGLKGTFFVKERSHGRVYMRKVWSDTFPQYEISDTYFDSLAIEKKTLTGPGLSALTWNYYYSENDGSWAGEEPDSLYKWLRVDAPDGSKTRYYFHRSFDWKEGLIAKTQVLNSSGTAIQTTTKSYVKGHYVGYGDSMDRLANHESDSVNSYLTKQVVSVNDDKYTTNYYNFDEYGRATKIVETNDFSSDSKTIEPTFEDHVSDWVLGLPKQTKINDKVTEKLYFCSDNTTTCRKYAPYRGDKFGAKVVGFTYHTDGTYKSISDGLSNAQAFANFKRGLPQSVTLPTTATMSVSVNGDGTIASITDFNNNFNSYDYDAAGRLTKAVLPKENGVTYWSDKDIDYLKITSNDGISGSGLVGGQWKQVITQGQYRLTRYYDALMRNVLTKEEDLTTGYVKYQRKEFDAYNRNTFTSVKSVSAGESVGHVTQYDGLGRVIKQISPSATTNFDYLSDNRKKVTNPRNKATTYTYQAFGSPSYEKATLIKSPEGVTTSISRDVFGKMLSVTQSGSFTPTGGVTQATQKYYYDARERLCRKSIPEADDIVYDYDAAGNMTWYAYDSSAGLQGCYRGSVPESDKVKYTYDALNRIETVNFPDTTPDQSYSYDAKGNVITAVAGDIIWDYSYNSLDLLKSENLSVEERIFNIGYGYNAIGHLASTEYPDGEVVSYAPNALGQVTKASSYADSLSYHPNGALKSLTFGNDAVYSMQQDSRGFPDIMKTQKNGSDIYHYDYDMDANGNITDIWDRKNYNYDRHMTYDGLDRLEAASGKWGSTDYVYDGLGNIAQKTVNNQLMQYQYGSNNRLNSISGLHSYQFQYDNQGNVTNNSKHSFNYNLANQMISGGSNSYQYDIHGRRVISEKSGGKVYSVYNRDGKLIYKEDYTEGKRTNYIYANGLVAEMKVELPKLYIPIMMDGITIFIPQVKAPDFSESSTEPAEVTYMHNDLLGSPVASTDGLGATRWTEHYKPFGEKMYNPSGDGSDVGFTGHQNDAGLGLTYMQARYYDPVVGRFYGVDPIDFRDVHSFNKYTYANSNPYKYTDPDGRAAVLACLAPGVNVACAALAEAAISGTVATVSFIGGWFAAEAIDDALEDSSDSPDSNDGSSEGSSDKSKKKEKAKDRRKRQKQEAKEKKFGEAGEPASEGYVKWKAKEKEKKEGKDGRRDAHDSKQDGEPDRTKEQIDEDYQ